VAGIVLENGRERRVGILAFKGCGQCLYCRTGRENLCAEVQHIGHASGWPEMPHYPGGMAEEFEVWKDFDYDLPDSISFEEAIFLDGLAVAVHAAGEARLEPGKRAGVIGLGPIGMLFAQLAAHRGAEQVTGWDTAPLPVRLARQAFEVMCRKEENQAYKIILTP
jgi:L-iditol 2-dehydrogenase